MGFLFFTRSTPYPVLHVMAQLGHNRTALWHASVARRLAATLTDVVVSLPWTIFCAALYRRWLMSGLNIPDGLAWYDALSVTFASFFGLVLGFWVVVTGSFCIYRYLAALFLGRTPGMVLWKIEFFTGKLKRPGPVRLFLREWIASVTLAFLGAGWLWAFFDESNRSLSDVLTGLHPVDAETDRRNQ